MSKRLSKIKVFVEHRRKICHVYTLNLRPNVQKCIFFVSSKKIDHTSGLFMKRGSHMKTKGLIRQPERAFRRCPFCHGDLGKIEYIKRKTLKKCRCPHCGKHISEKNIHW